MNKSWRKYSLKGSPPPHLSQDQGLQDLLRYRVRKPSSPRRNCYLGVRILKDIVSRLPFLTVYAKRTSFGISKSFT